jgi:hypothetical protein
MLHQAGWGGFCVRQGKLGSMERRGTCELNRKIDVVA